MQDYARDGSNKPCRDEASLVGKVRLALQHGGQFVTQRDQPTYGLKSSCNLPLTLSENIVVLPKPAIRNLQLKDEDHAELSKLSHKTVCVCVCACVSACGLLRVGVLQSLGGGWVGG